MGQQEDFRTPAGGTDAAPQQPPTPIFDERSARTAAPVVPLDRVARRERFKRWAGRLRDTTSSPQFRRSWPLALLLVATLAAAVAATNVYTDDDAQSAAPADDAATVASPANVTATADAEITARAASDDSRSESNDSRGESGDTLQARDARRESNAPADAASIGGSQTFAASALGGILGNADDSNAEQGGPSASSRDERDRGKRQKRSKRRHGARRTRGGAILFDVIR